MIELTDEELEQVIGGTRPAPERACWATVRSGKCYAAPWRGEHPWPQALRDRRYR